MKKIYIIFAVFFLVFLFLYLIGYGGKESSLSASKHLLGKSYESFLEYDDYKIGVSSISRRGVDPVVNHLIHLIERDDFKIYKKDLLAAINSSGYLSSFNNANWYSEKIKINSFFNDDMISDFLVLPDLAGVNLFVSLFNKKQLSLLLKEADLVFALSKLNTPEARAFFMKYADILGVKIHPVSLSERLIDLSQESAINQLMDLLKGENNIATRLRIIKALGQCRDINEVVKSLINILLERKQLRYEEKSLIFHIMQGISTNHVDMDFVYYLKQDKYSSNLIELFGFLKNKKALVPLKKIYNDTFLDKSVRRSAAISLAQIGDDELLEELIVLVKKNQLDHWLIDQDVKSIAEIKDIRLFDSLVVVLKERLLSAWVGQHVLYSGKVKNYEEQSHRHKLSQQKNIVLNIIEALTVLGDERTIEFFKDLLLNDDIKSIDVRICLASGLYQLGDDQGFDYLISFIESEKVIDTAYKYHAMIVLFGEIGGKREVSALVDLFTKKYTSRKHREYIAEILLNSDSEVNIQPIVDMVIREKINHDFIDPATIILSNLGGLKVAKSMLQMLTPEKIDHIGYAIATIMANTGDNSLVEPLFKIIENNKNSTSQIERYICVVSLMVLGEIGDVSCIDRLMNISSEGVFDISNVAVLSLGRLADKAAVEALLLFLQERFKGGNYERDVNFLIEMMRDDTVSILTKRYIVKALAEIELYLDSR